MMKPRLSYLAIYLMVFGTSVSLSLPARAYIFIIGFEDATNVPTSSVPSTNDISNTFADAYPGDTVDGVLFDDNFSVFSANYTNNVGGTDLYGSADGNYAITNTAGGGTADTGPGDAGLDGLTFTTSDVLQSVSFAANDYGNGSFGADQVTVTAYGNSGDLASASEQLVDGFYNPITTLTALDTASTFDPYAGQITGYRINREVSSDYALLGSGGGNYVADDFTFSAVPEPSPLVALPTGICCLAGLIFIGRKKRQSHARAQ